MRKQKSWRIFFCQERTTRSKYQQKKVKALPLFVKIPRDPLRLYCAQTAVVSAHKKLEQLCALIFSTIVHTCVDRLWRQVHFDGWRSTCCWPRPSTNPQVNTDSIKSWKDLQNSQNIHLIRGRGRRVEGSGMSPQILSFGIWLLPFSFGSTLLIHSNNLGICLVSSYFCPLS